MAPKLLTVSLLVASLIVCAMAGPSDEYLMLHFFKQLGTARETELEIVPAVPGYDATHFGQILVQDSTLTRTKDPESQVLGRGHGVILYASMDPTQYAIDQVWTASFDDELYDEPSTLIFRGFDPLAAPEREIAIVGGTGSLRSATGYVIQTVVYLDDERVTIENTAYVFIPHKPAS